MSCNYEQLMTIWLNFVYLIICKYLDISFDEYQQLPVILDGSQVQISSNNFMGRLWSKKIILSV